MIASSLELMALLDKSGLTIDDVDDYHRYPIADNDSPRLSADRLEYTLGNAHLVFHCPKAELKRIFDDHLSSVKNEDSEDELCFAHAAQIADAFTQLSPCGSRSGSSPTTTASACRHWPIILRKARQRNVLTVDDLYLDEPHVISPAPLGPGHCRALAGISLHCRHAKRPRIRLRTFMPSGSLQKSAASTRWCKHERRAAALHQPVSADYAARATPPSARMISTAGSGPRFE